MKLDAVTAFAEHLVLSERADGLDRLSVMRVEDGDIFEIEFPDPVYTAWIGPNEEYDNRSVRFGYTSLVAPSTDVDFDMETRKGAIVKTQPVLGGYDASSYTSAREWATASDGTRIPISIVRRTDTPLDGSAPAVLYGYGSYEHSTDPAFRASRLSLLDRGFVFAIAHVRVAARWGAPGTRKDASSTRRTRSPISSPAPSI